MKRISIILLLLMVAHCNWAQTNTDSSNQVLLDNYQQKLKIIEQKRIDDSLKRVELENQLQNLKLSESYKKDLLQQQIKQLEQEEQQRIQEKKQKIDSLRLTAIGSPVLDVFKDTLFVIYTRIGSLTVKERAEAVAERIKKLSKDYTFSPDSIKVSGSKHNVDIIAGENIIISITEDDALWANTNVQDLATLYQKIIIDSIKKYRSETSAITIIKEVGLALLVLFILGLMIFYLGKFFRWLALKVHAQKGKFINGIQIKNYTLFDANKHLAAYLTLLNIIKWVLIVVLVYIALPIIFGIFPWTENFADTLLGYIVNPLKKILFGIWNYLPNLFTILVIIIVFRYVKKVIHFLKSEIEQGKLSLPGFYPDWANPTYQIIRVLLYAFMFVLIFPYLPGSNSPIFQGVSVFLGFLFTFGSAGSLSNIVSGLVLTYMRLFKIGDRVKIGEVVGDVIEKSLLVTRVKTIKNEIISIPNSTVMSSHTVNYSSECEHTGLIVHTTVTIGYDVPWKKMHEALLLAADRTELILKDPKPFVLQTSLDDFYVSYQINGYTKEANKQALIYSELHQHIQDCCNEMGIEILSPHYRAARDGNATTIPANYLNKNYQAPSFNIHLKKDSTT